MLIGIEKSGTSEFGLCLVKPAQLTPLSALALMQLAAEAGIPHGVVNMLPSSQAKAVGKVLTEHPNVQKFSLTGSTAIGKQLMAQCSSSMKKVSMELGGNAAFIIFDDADLDVAIEQLLAAKFRNAGQTCIAVNRVLVHDSIIAEVEQRLIKALSKLKLGAGHQQGVGRIHHHQVLYAHQGHQATGGVN